QGNQRWLLSEPGAPEQIVSHHHKDPETRSPFSSKPRRRSRFSWIQKQTRRAYTGPVIGSILIDNVEDYVFVMASHQIRIHRAKKMRSRPIIEDSNLSEPEDELAAMRGISYTPSPPRGYGRRGRTSPSPRGGRYGGRSADLPTSFLVRNLRHDCSRLKRRIKDAMLLDMFHLLRFSSESKELKT
ncbi:hypothetical protein HID58_059655, partial [Brassica napus]